MMYTEVDKDMIYDRSTVLKEVALLQRDVYMMPAGRDLVY